jgi:hypothetical protein
MCSCSSYKDNFVAEWQVEFLEYACVRLRMIKNSLVKLRCRKEQPYRDATGCDPTGQTEVQDGAAV